jgi:hypothetical protein
VEKHEFAVRNHFTLSRKISSKNKPLVVEIHKSSGIESSHTNECKSQEASDIDLSLEVLKDDNCMSMCISPTV